MSYKTILVHVDDSSHVEKRIEVAAAIAVSENAHLIGAAVTGISKLLPGLIVEKNEEVHIEPDPAEHAALLQKRAYAALDKFEEIVRNTAVKSYERRLIQDDAATGISMQAQYCDLIVLGQSNAENTSGPDRIDFTEYVVLNSECPILIVPDAWKTHTEGQSVLVAWNGSMAASRALRNSMPLLQRAKKVELAVFRPVSCLAKPADKLQSDLCTYLERHGIKVNVVIHKAEGDVGHALLTLASELSSDLMVMGCVAHPHVGGIMLGGATRIVLESMTVPVLMSH